ncbi:MAG TPA: type II toxin-antitoxin system VapC family toxin [Thermodesulfobacteriota bacterium]|nr:type II toxin-antitoxin system VapC family toxin [Thermodesulfobacteriota bacterium]
MNNKIVVDTNVVVALLDMRDVHHNKALNLIRRLESEEKDLLLMDCILNEVYTVLARRSLERGYRFSEIVGKIKNELESFETIRAYRFVNKIHDNIVELMVRTNGRLNYHDALMSIVMKEKGVEEIVTFDRDFKDIKWLKTEDGS